MEQAERIEGTSGRGYTLFGETVLRLARSRGILRQEDLAERLKKSSGFPYRQQRLSRYFNGDRPAYKRLAVHLAAALDLDEAERAELANAFAYGQDQKTSGKS